MALFTGLTKGLLAPRLPRYFREAVLDFKQCGFNHTHLALATQGSDDFLLRGFWPQHATLPPLGSSLQASSACFR